MAEPQIRVTVEDLLTGEREVREITDDYVIVAAGRCEIAHVQASARGTHQITVRNAGGVNRLIGSTAHEEEPARG